MSDVLPLVFTALMGGAILAYVVLDGYDLETEARELLIALGLYKIRRFLNTGLRLRTACDLIPQSDVRVMSPSGFVLPHERALLGKVQAAIKACAENNLFHKPPVLKIGTPVVLKETDEENLQSPAASGACVASAVAHFRAKPVQLVLERGCAGLHGRLQYAGRSDLQRRPDGLRAAHGAASGAIDSRFCF